MYLEANFLLFVSTSGCEAVLLQDKKFVTGIPLSLCPIIGNLVFLVQA